jgi:hypothetical protein
MSMLLDDRETPGLADCLARFGLPVSTVRLEFGDLAIQTCDGRLVGYERKHLTDLIACMQDRRLAGHQLRGMWGLYDRVELVIEGPWRPGENGEIEVLYGGRWTTLYHRGAGISYRQLDSYLYSQYECGGVPCWRTGTMNETAHLYASRFHWWQKDYELHRSHDVIFSNNPSAQQRGAVTVHQGEPNPVTLWAAQIPGLDSKAWDIGKYFGSPREMANATAADWTGVPWTDRKGKIKHLGKETAKKIDAWLAGRKV